MLLQVAAVLVIQVEEVLEKSPSSPESPAPRPAVVQLVQEEPFSVPLELEPVHALLVETVDPFSSYLIAAERVPLHREEAVDTITSPFEFLIPAPLTKDMRSLAFVDPSDKTARHVPVRDEVLEPAAARVAHLASAPVSPPRFPL